MCLSNLVDGILIPQLLHRGSDVELSCSIATLYFQCVYINCSRILSWLCTLSGHPFTRHATNVSTHGNETTNISTPPLLMPTVLCHGIPMDYLHVVLELLCRHCRSKLLTTYQCSLTLPECVSLSRLPLFLRHLTFLPPDEYGGTYHCLCLIHVFLQANPLKHAYKHLQLLLHPHGFSTRDMAVVCVD